MGNKQDYESEHEPTAAQKAQAEIPDNETIDKLFDELLEKRGMKSSMLDSMRKMPPDKKWIMINQQKGIQEEKQDSASNWIDFLKSSDITVEQLRELRVCIASNSKEWLEEFHEGGGLLALLSVFNTAPHRPTALNPDTLQLECLTSLKAFMNNDYGIEVVMNLPEAVDNIALCLESENPYLRMQVMKLLTVICYIESRRDPPTNYVVQAMSHFQQLKSSKRKFAGSRFKVIVDVLKENKNIDLTCNAMTFINTIINCCFELEKRVSIRREFIDLDILKHLSTLRDLISKHTGQSFRELEQQLDNFDGINAIDQRDILFKEMDCSDPQQLFNFLLTGVRQDGYVTELTTILQLLITIPGGRPLGSQMWHNIAFITHKAVLTSEDIPEERELDPDKPLLAYPELFNLLLEKEAKDAQEHKDLLRALQEQIEENRRSFQEEKMRSAYSMEMALQLDAENQELKKKIEALKKGEDYEVQTKHIDLKALTQNADGSGGPGGNVPQLIGVPIMGGGGGPGGFGGGAPEEEEEAPEAPPCPDDDGPPPMPDAPPPMCPGMMEDTTSNLKKKPKIKPKVRMRPFHWQTVKNKVVEGSVWFDIDETTLDIDIDLIEKEFCQKDLKPKPNEEKEEEEKKKVDLKKPKKVYISLIEHKRAYQIDISLAMFRMTNIEIRDAVWAMDDRVLTAEKASSLAILCPKSDEVELMNGYDGDIEQLANADKFHKYLAEIPNVSNRVGLLNLKHNFIVEIAEIEDDMSAVERALNSIKDNKKISYIITVMLAFGNYINGGSSKGGAYGFTIDTLAKFSSTKTVDNKGTLLQSIIRFVQKKKPEYVDFPDDLKDCSTKIECNYLKAEVAKLGQKIQKCKTALEVEPTDKRDMIKVVMGPFYKAASQRFEKTQGRIEKLEKTTLELAKYFGEEEPDKMLWEILIQIFRDFAAEWKNTITQMAEIDRKLKQAAKRELYLEERRKQMAERKKALDTDVMISQAKQQKAVVDNVFVSLRAGTTDTILEEIRQRAATARNRTDTPTRTRPVIKGPQGKVTRRTTVRPKK